MQKTLIERLEEDVRIKEGLNACMNCGICTAVCPAAEFYEYDPRSIVLAVQSKNEKRIAALLEEDTIWYCGQCMSCKPRCPRSNSPGSIISVLRKLSQETGAFVKSKKGRQQYVIMKTVGQNILNFGYCIHPTKVEPSNHPEQGTVWEWVFDNMEDVYNSVEANLDSEGAGALRKIPQTDLDELHAIFKQSGGFDLYDKIDNFSQQKALQIGLKKLNGQPDMDKYTDFIYSE